MYSINHSEKGKYLVSLYHDSLTYDLSILFAGISKRGDSTRRRRKFLVSPWDDTGTVVNILLYPLGLEVKE